MTRVLENNKREFILNYITEHLIHYFCWEIRKRKTFLKCRLFSWFKLIHHKFVDVAYNNPIIRYV